MLDGHLNKCKECTKEDAYLYRQNSEASRDYDKKRYQENPERRKIAQERVIRMRNEFPEKRKAHTAVSNAIRDGKLTKPDHCNCGSTKRIVGHHEDYTKLLEVIWMCQRCHVQLHKDRGF